MFTCRLWDVETGEQLGVFKSHRGPVTSVCRASLVVDCQSESMALNSQHCSLLCVLVLLHLPILQEWYVLSPLTKTVTSPGFANERQGYCISWLSYAWLRFKLHTTG